MGQATVSINNRTYGVGCEDGQESHLRALAETVDAKVREIGGDTSGLGETRLMLMGALLIADELETARASLAAETAKVRALEDEVARSEARAVVALEAAAARLEQMAGR
ncbi:MAG: cell division protein ZapA [Caulobacteraceae bacterium]|nr:cell division protein ZapA [Caulobacteraceae bacterium]